MELNRKKYSHSIFCAVALKDTMTISKAGT